MSEIGEISQHEIAPQKTKPEHGGTTHAEASLTWTRNGDTSSARLINKNNKRDRSLWAEVGDASYDRNFHIKTHGMHPLWNSGRSNETFFYIQEIAEEKHEPYVQPTEIQESPLITFSPEGKGINLWSKGYKKRQLYDMCAHSGEESFVAMHLEGNTLSIANKGNFQAVLGQQGKAEALTTYVPEEEAATITEHTLPKGESQLILGSAGLWDFMSPEEATQLITQIQNSEEASIALREEARKRAELRNGTVGDISVIVVNLNVPEGRVPLLSRLRQKKAERNYRQRFVKAA